MKETREITIENKVFTKENIAQLAHKFKQQVSSSTHNRLTFKLISEDNVDFESDNLEDMLTDVVNTKVVKSIHFNFTDYDLDRHMYLKLSTGDSYRNYFTISSSDLDWLKSLFQQFEEDIRSFQKSTMLLKEYPKLFCFLLSAFFGYFLVDIYIDISDFFSTYISTSGDKKSQFSLLLKESQLFLYTCRVAIWSFFGYFTRIFYY